MRYGFSIDMVGNRFWRDGDTLMCAPLLEDGTPEMENAGEAEAMGPEAQAALVNALRALEEDVDNW